jgi:hypothetical protein
VHSKELLLFSSFDNAFQGNINGKRFKLFLIYFSKERSLMVKIIRYLKGTEG